MDLSAVSLGLIALLRGDAPASPVRRHKPATAARLATGKRVRRDTLKRRSDAALAAAWVARNPSSLRVCGYCSQRLPAVAYAVDRAAPDGRQRLCRLCRYERYSTAAE